MAIMQSIYESDYSSMSSFTSEQQYLDKKLHEKMTGFYDSCMSESAINAKGAQPMIDLLTEVYTKDMNGSLWTTAPSKAVLAATLGKSHNRKVDVVFQPWVDYDESNSNAYIFSIWNVDAYYPLGSKEAYSDSAILSVYNTTATTLFKTFIKPVIDPNMNDSRVDELVATMLDFETKLATASYSRCLIIYIL